MRNRDAIQREKMPVIFSALGDPTRFRIFQILSKKRDACVTDIANMLKISVPAASHQLKILEMSGLARKERNGQMICYKLKDDEVIVKAIMKIIK